MEFDENLHGDHLHFTGTFWAKTRFFHGRVFFFTGKKKHCLPPERIGKIMLEGFLEIDQCCRDFYKYLNVEIPPLSMVDDVLTISTCGPDSIVFSTY